MDLARLTALIGDVPAKGRRRMVALAGAPASGKSTLAAALMAHDPALTVVPMDGFHLDNTLLAPRGLLERKGAPETFDVAGLVHLVRRLASGEEAVFPIFDRALDKAIAGAGVIDPDCETIVVEGNYLLFDKPVWRDLSALWDLTIRLDVPRDELHARLIGRWEGHGLDPETARRKAEMNDLVNADLVMDCSLPSDLTLGESILQ
ncbi:nucleoside/nucleotide kinase family protein [Arenibacterium sp. CAU 1754]